MKKIPGLIILFFFVSASPNAQNFALKIKGKHFTAPVEYDYRTFNFILCNNSTFEQKVSFSQCSIISNADFTFTHFLKLGTFKDATFYNGADFSYAIFSKTIDFASITSKGNMLFDSTQFEEDVVMWSSKVSADTYFRHTQFDKDAVFIGSQFKNIIVLGCNSNGEVRFDECRFLDGAQFKNVVLNRGIDLSEAHLGKRFILDNIKTNALIRIEHAYLPDTLELKSIELALPLDFDRAIPNPETPTLVYIENIDINNLWLDFSKVILCFPNESNLTIEARITLFQDLIKLEEKRNRRESYLSLKKQFKQFLQ